MAYSTQGLVRPQLQTCSRFQDLHFPWHVDKLEVWNLTRVVQGLETVPLKNVKVSL